jgi:hypothetical protein
VHRYKNFVVRNEKLFWEEIAWSDESGHAYAASLKDDNEVIHDGGSWPSLQEAGEWLELMMQELSKPDPSRREDPLAKYRDVFGVHFLVTIDQTDNRYAIVVATKKGYIDAGPRFDTAEAAREVICQHS